MKDSRKALEHIFANNFASPVFPILADLYCKNKEYERALKVCSIGLNNDPDNFTGQFILSKIHLAMKNEKEAEQILKTEIEKDWPGPEINKTRPSFKESIIVTAVIEAAYISLTNNNKIIKIKL